MDMHFDCPGSHKVYVRVSGPNLGRIMIIKIIVIIIIIIIILIIILIIIVIIIINIIIIIIIIINIIMLYSPTSPTLFGVSCRDKSFILAAPGPRFLSRDLLFFFSKILCLQAHRIPLLQLVFGYTGTRGP